MRSVESTVIAVSVPHRGSSPSGTGASLDGLGCIRGNETTATTRARLAPGCDGLRGMI